MNTLLFMMDRDPRARKSSGRSIFSTNFSSRNPALGKIFILFFTFWLLIVPQIIADSSSDAVSPSVAALSSSITEGINDIDGLLKYFIQWFTSQGGKISPYVHITSKPPLCPLGLLHNYMDNNDSVSKTNSPWWSNLGASATGMNGNSIRGSSSSNSGGEGRRDSTTSSSSVLSNPRRTRSSSYNSKNHGSSNITPYRGDIHVRSKSRIPRETVLIGVPHHLLMLPVAIEICTLCNPSERLVLRLVDEFNKGTDSLWYPYIILLPNYVPNAVMYTDEDMDILYNTYAGGITKGVQSTFKKFLYKIKASVRNKYNDNILRWAYTIVQSRAFTVGSPVLPSLSMNTSNSTIFPSTIHDLYGVPFLAPGADFFNHKPSSKIGWNLQLSSTSIPIDKSQQGNEIMDQENTESQARLSTAIPSRLFGIVTLEPYNTVNMEIFNNYHDTATNAHLLAQYGFIYGDNNDYDRIWSISTPSPKNNNNILTKGKLQTKQQYFNRYDGVVITLPVPSTVYHSFAHVRKDLIAHVRQLVDRQQATEKDVDFVANLLPYTLSTGNNGPNKIMESLLTLPSNVTVILHGQGSGPLPNILLNLARLTALALPSTATWLDAHGAIAYGGTTTGVSLPLQYLHGNQPLGSHEDMKNAIIIPRSATEELERIDQSLKERIIALTRQNMDRLIGTDQTQKLFPLPTNNLTNPTKGTGDTVLSSSTTNTLSSYQRMEVTRDGSVHSTHLDSKDYVSSSISVSYLLDGHLNTSVLTEILAMRILKKSIEKLIDNYPSSYSEGEQLYQQIQSQLYDAIQACRGIRKKSSDGTVVSGSTSGTPNAEVSYVSADRTTDDASLSGKKSSGTISTHVTNKEGGTGRAAAIAAAAGSLTGNKRKNNPYFDPRYLTETDVDDLNPMALVEDVQQYQRQAMMLQCRLTEQTILQSALQQVNNRLVWAQRIIFPDTDIPSLEEEEKNNGGGVRSTQTSETVNSNKPTWKWSKDSTHPNQQQEQRAAASMDLDTPSGTLPVSFTNRHTHEEIDTEHGHPPEDETGLDNEENRIKNKQPSHQHGHSAHEVLHDMT